MASKNQKVNEKIDAIIERIRGKYSDMIWLGKEYSKAHLIVELKEIKEMLKPEKRKRK